MSKSSSVPTTDRDNAVGEELARLAAAAETPPRSDQLLAEAWDRLRRLGEALRLQSEELAIERRRNAELRAELQQMRGGRRGPGPRFGQPG